jgi:hypothetical protein
MFQYQNSGLSIANTTLFWDRMKELFGVDLEPSFQ